MKHAKLLFFKTFVLIILVFLIFSANQVSYAQITRNVSFSKSTLITKPLIAEDGIEYQRIGIDDLIFSGEPGEPNLPVKYIRLLIPSNEDVSNITVSIKNSEVINLSNAIYPSQPAIPTSANPIGIKFVKPDSNIYNSEKPWPNEIVKVKCDGYFDGSNHIVILEIFPLRYYPKLNQLEFISELDFTLQMKSSTKLILSSGKKSEENQEIYNNALKLIVESSEKMRYRNRFIRTAVFFRK
jgi:hypothetical protein